MDFVIIVEFDVFVVEYYGCGVFNNGVIKVECCVGVLYVYLNLEMGMCDYFVMCMFEVGVFLID